MRVLAFDGASPALERQWDVMEAAGGVEAYVFWKRFSTLVWIKTIESKYL